MTIGKRIALAYTALTGGSMSDGVATSSGDAGRYSTAESVNSDGGIVGRIVSALGGGRTKASVVVTPANAMCLPAVFAAISAISNPIGSVPTRLHHRDPDTGVTRVAREHPAHKLVARRANPRTNSGVFRKTVQGHALGHGNGYAEIQRRRNGDPVALWQLLPDRTAAELKTDGRLVYNTNVDGKSFTIPAEDVLHIKGLSFDGIVGYSPIRLAREAIGVGVAAQEFGAKFFANEAKSGGVLMHPGKLSGGAKTNIRDSFEEQGGLDNAHRVKVLEEGMKWVSTTIPPDDAQFLGTREFTIADVARMFGVPLFLLQSMEKTSSWGSGISEMLIGFVKLTLANWAVTWEEELNAKLLTEAEQDAGYYFKVDLRGLMRGDDMARAAFYGDGIADGWMTRADARELEDLNPIDGLDEPLVPLNMETVQQAAARHQRENDAAKAARDAQAQAGQEQPRGGGRKSKARQKERAAKPPQEGADNAE